MATANVFQAELRGNLGKGASREVRRNGRVPAVIYGGTTEPLHVTLHPVELDKQLKHTGFLSRVFTVDCEKKKETVLARDVQFHPVTDLPLHVDFMRVQKGVAITASIPLSFINEGLSPGLKKGGVLNISMHNLEVSCPVDKMPESIVIDLTGLELHTSVHLKDITLPEGVVATHPDRDNDLANIVAPTIMKQTAEDEAAPEESSSESENKTE